MSTLNKRLSGPTQLTNAAVTQYTCPAGTVAIVQHLHVENADVLPCTFTMSIGADEANKRLYDQFSIPANGVLDVFCKYVLTAAEVIQALGGTTLKLVMTMDGQELTAG